MSRKHILSIKDKKFPGRLKTTSVEVIQQKTKL